MSVETARKEEDIDPSSLGGKWDFGRSDITVPALYALVAPRVLSKRPEEVEPFSIEYEGRSHNFFVDKRYGRTILYCESPDPDEDPDDVQAAWWLPYQSGSAGFLALDEEVATLKSERALLLARIRQTDEAIQVAETQREWAVRSHTPRPPAEVVADLERICKGDWMDAPRYANLPIEVKIMVLQATHLTPTEGGAIRDDDTGILTWDDLRTEYVAWVTEEG